MPLDRFIGQIHLKVKGCHVCFICCKFTKVITKTRLYNFDPLKPHFYIVKLGFTGVSIIFLISAFSRNMKNIRIFLSENFHFLVVKFSLYLNRHVFVMKNIDCGYSLEPPR